MPFRADHIAAYLGISRSSIPKLLKAAGVERRINPHPKKPGFDGDKYLPFTDAEVALLFRTFHAIRRGRKRAKYAKKPSE